MAFYGGNCGNMGFALHNFPDGKFAHMGVRFAPALAVFAFRARKSNAHLSVRIALKQKHRSGLLIPTQGQAVGLAPNSRINQNTPGKSRGYLNLYGEGGIRTLDTGNPPYDGLANRCLQPLGHLSIYPQPRFKLRDF